MNSPSPSPLVPQGSIPQKNTTRSARVLLIGLTVVTFHVAVLSLILLQGCQKDANKTASASETNNTPLSLPSLDASTNQFYTTASNVPVSAPVANIATNPAPGPVVTSAPPVTVALQEPPTSLPQGSNETPATTGGERDYKVVAGDNLSKIASKNKVNLSALLALNPNLDPKKLKVGQTLKLPAPSAAAAAPVTARATATTTTPAGTGTPATATTAIAAGTYKVKPGDNLIRIAKAHGVSVAELQAANNLRSKQLLAGRVLKIPAKTQRTASSSNGVTAAH
jgi:LysM repeat protein